MPHTDSLVTRNSPIINHELQQKISKTRLALIGCGLGSNIAVLASRVGFKHYILADGDVVEDSNLNRQEYFSSDLGQNKAVCLAKRLSSINAEAKIKVKENFITDVKEIDEIVKWADIVINTADFENGFYQVNNSAGKLSKVSIIPFNVGYGSVITVFGEINKDYLRNTPPKGSSDGDHFLQLLKQSRSFDMPGYFLPTFETITNNKSKVEYIPQIGIAANISAANAVTVIINFLSGEPIPYYPKVSHIDTKNV